MTALKIEQVPIDSLTPNPRNYRKHPSGQIGEIAHSLTEFGQFKNIVVSSDGIILAGEGVWTGAKRRGDETIAAFRTDFDADDPRAQKLMVADNALARLAEDDDAQLAQLLREVSEEMGLEGTGYDEEGLEALRAEVAELMEAEEDSEPPEDPGPDELREEAVTKPGDVWLLGGHRLVCGDCTEAHVWEGLFGEERADAIITSPPYTDQREYTIGEFDWLALMQGATIGMFVVASPTCQILVNLGLSHKARHVDMYWMPWLDYCKQVGWPLFGWYVWDKGSGMPGEWNGRLAPCHEWLFHFNEKGGIVNKWHETTGENARCRKRFRQPDGSLREATSPELFGQLLKVPESVVRIQRELARGIHTQNHPAVFPPELPAFCMRTWTEKGAVVYEPFLGSGTTIIAAEQLNRRCYGIEIEPRYVDVAVKRWQNMTGEPAILEATGEPFPVAPASE